MHSQIHKPMTWTLAAVAVSSMLSPAYGEGYSVQNANRGTVKPAQWSCKQCKPTTGYQGSLGAGVAYNDGNDPAFGNTTGTDTDGVVAYVEADTHYQNEAGYRAAFEAHNLGYDAGSASLSAAKVGQYSVSLGYRGFANDKANSAMSPYTQNGDLQVLPSDWQTAGTTAGMTSLNSSLMDKSLGIQRDRFTIAGHYLGDNYSAKLNYRHEERNGQKKTSANILTNSVMLAAPIDDSNDELDARLYFKGDKWLVGINSQISQYENDHKALQWQSAFTPTFGAAYSGQNAQDPDNKAYRVGADAQLNADRHQVLMHLGFARMTQDDEFLPATINGPSPLLPQTSLDGQIDVLDMALKYYGRISRELNVKVHYDYQDRSSETSLSDYPQVVTDSFYQGLASNPDYDRISQNVGIDAKYRFTSDINLDIGYDYDHKQYSDLDRDLLFESSLMAKLNYRINPQWKLWLKAEGSDRNGGDYQAVTRTQSLSNPYLRKSYLADRKRYKVTLHGDYALADNLTLGGGVFTLNEDYHNTQVGLTEVQATGYDLTAQYAINSDVSVNAYVSQDWRDSDQAGSNNFGLPNWYSAIEDSSTLFGTGLLYQRLWDNSVDVGIDYTYSKGESDTDVTQGITGRYGDYFSRKHNINAYAKYRVNDNINLRFDWLFEHYKDANGMSDLALDAIPNVLTFGPLQQDYNAHYFGLTLSYQL